MTWFWGLLAAAALLWPDRVSGPFDGVPLDRIPEAIAVAALFPLLWCLCPRFLHSRRARALIVVLVVWRTASALLLVQDGWCVRFVPARPYAKDATGAPHAWDLRADWRSPDPECSAIVTRQYHDLREFPAWFFNLPPANDSWPEAGDRPPEAVVAMTVHGFLTTPEPGRLRIEQRTDAPTQMIVDGRPASADEALGPGVHTVAVRTTLMGGLWRFVARWNDDDLWAARIATVTKPSRLDVFVRHWLAWVPVALVLLLLAAWIARAIQDVSSTPMIAWVVIAAGTLAVLVAFDRADLARGAVVALAAGALVPVPRHWQSTRGAFLLIGVPWMTFIVASAASAIGRFVIYEGGNDFWMFQRFAYRIVMQGYWLEGGSPTFWFQPLYRWLVALLHLIFGDSSAGEWYWDGACLIAGALFAFRLVQPFAGFRWALMAAVLPLTTFVWGTAQYLIGRGLSELSSAGLAYAAALSAIRARTGRWPAAALAGVLAMLAFYTRLNNLPMACGVTLLAVEGWPTRPKWWREPAIVLGFVATGLILFAWRTWHYTGVFSVFYGTQRDVLAIWQPGMSITTAANRALGSVMMVLTVNDPARFDPYALPVLAGAAVALLWVIRVRPFREVPAAAVLFFLASISGALVARGTAYAGRFSVHIIPIACALTVCGAAAVTRRNRTSAARAAATEPSAPTIVVRPPSPSARA
jgi:hypothetical protein